MVRLVRLLLAPAVFLCLLVAALPALAQEAVAPAAPLTIGEQLLRDVVPQLILALSLGLGLLVAWLRSKAARAITESKMSGAAKGALEWAQGLAFEVVMAGVGSVRDWKAELADGKISQAELDAKLAGLKAAALKTVQDNTIGRLLGSGAVASTEAAAAVVDSLVESAVVKAEVATRAAPANPPAPPAG